MRNNREEEDEEFMVVISYNNKGQRKESKQHDVILSRYITVNSTAGLQTRNSCEHRQNMHSNRARSTADKKSIKVRLGTMKF